MVRKITNRLYKVNTYAGHLILEVDDFYDEDDSFNEIMYIEEN